MIPSSSTSTWQACAAGLEEIVLQPPLRVYHIDHSGGFSDRLRRIPPPGLRWLEKLPLPARHRNRLISVLGRAFGLPLRSEVKGIPTLDWSECIRLAREMVAGQRSPLFNGSDWGLGNDVLTEETLLRAAWEPRTSAPQGNGPPATPRSARVEG